MNKNLNLCFLGLVLFITACAKKDEPQTLPSLTTMAVNSIMQSSALAGGNVTSDAGASIIARGICWSVTANPTIDNNKTLDGVGIGPFTSSMPTLIPGTTYYLRAYATNANGTSYGNVFKFSTLALATSITDRDGNTYQTVNIGTQTWMAENLKTTKYRTGEDISNPKDSTSWRTASFGAWCNNNNDTTNGRIYGRLYNYLAITDARNIAPIGWHVASQAEWTTLVNYLGGESIAGAKLRGSSGFNALPGGDRDPSGAFGEVGGEAYWWSTTENTTTLPIAVWYWYTSINKSRAYKYYDSKAYGFSVRCVKDKAL